MYGDTLLVQMFNLSGVKFFAMFGGPTVSETHDFLSEIEISGRETERILACKIQTVNVYMNTYVINTQGGEAISVLKHFSVLVYGQIGIFCRSTVESESTMPLHETQCCELLLVFGLFDGRRWQ